MSFFFVLHSTVETNIHPARAVRSQLVLLAAHLADSIVLAEHEKRLADFLGHGSSPVKVSIPHHLRWQSSQNFAQAPSGLNSISGMLSSGTPAEQYEHSAGAGDRGPLHVT
jgi:hypothetical protein